MGKIKKNLGYQTIYQVLNTLLPLITSPYLSRVLGASQLGVYSYTYSIVNYFTLFALLGTVNYGTRSIATSKHDLEKCRGVFWGIYGLQLTTGIIALISYGLYLVFFCKDNQLIALIQMISILSCAIDISWLFFGLENFKITVARNLVIKALTFSLIFLLVKTSKDLWLYTLLMAGGIVSSQMVLWINFPKFCQFQRKRWVEIVAHIKPNVVLFIPLLAMSVYHILDKTMLGMMSTYEESGFYYVADKVVNIPVGVISGMGVVLLPHIASLIRQNEKTIADELFMKSLQGITLVSAAIAFGIASVAEEFTPIFFGPGYEGCVILIIALSLVLIVKGFSLTIRTEYLIPNHMEKRFTQSVLAGSIVNIMINLVLIPIYGALGAVIGTVAAELLACIWQYLSIIRNTSIRRCILPCFQYVLYGLIMFCCIRLLASRLNGTIADVLIEIAVGGVVYSILCLIGWSVARDSFGASLLHTLLRVKTAKGSLAWVYAEEGKVAMYMKKFLHAFKCVLTLLSPELNAKVIYYVKFRKKLDMSNPLSFKEKLVTLKVKKYNSDPLVRQCADKYAVRQYLSDKGYGALLNELIAVYDSPNQIEWDRLPNQFAMKWNFGCGFNIICADKGNLDIAGAIKKLKKWERSKNYLEYAELQYRGVKKRIVVDKYLQSKDGTLPEDYKLYCFNGEVKAILYVSERNTENVHAAFFDTDWNYVGTTGKKKYKELNVLPPRPASLFMMIEAAEALSMGFPFVRVDFYEIDGQAVFGEMTFTPAGGNDISEINMNGKTMGELLAM